MYILPSSSHLNCCWCSSFLVICWTSDDCLFNHPKFSLLCWYLCHICDCHEYPPKGYSNSSNPIRGAHLDDISAKTLLRQLPEYTSFTLQYRLTHCMRATDGLEWIPMVFTTGLHALENSLIFSWVSSLARALDPLRPQKALVLCVCHLENAWLKHNINWNEFNKLIFDLEKLKTKG